MKPPNKAILKIIALDLGGTSAFATNDGEVGHWDMTRKGKAKRPECLANFWAELDLQIMCMGDLDVLIYERPFARGAAATRALWGYAGICEALAHHHGAAVLDLTPGQIKKWATGNAKATKEEMLVAAKKLGYGGENEHEADAYCLMKYAVAEAIKGKSK